MEKVMFWTIICVYGALALICLTNIIIAAIGRDGFDVSDWFAGLIVSLSFGVFSLSILFKFYPNLQ